jgi:hypothetical protein
MKDGKEPDGACHLAGSLDRRAFVRATLAGALGGAFLAREAAAEGEKPLQPAGDPAKKLGIPGPFPGRVA